MLWSTKLRFHYVCPSLWKALFDCQFAPLPYIILFWSICQELCNETLVIPNYRIYFPSECLDNFSNWPRVWGWEGKELLFPGSSTTTYHGGLMLHFLLFPSSQCSWRKERDPFLFWPLTSTGDQQTVPAMSTDLGDMQHGGSGNCMVNWSRSAQQSPCVRVRTWIPSCYTSVFSSNSLEAHVFWTQFITGQKAAHTGIKLLSLF